MANGRCYASVLSVLSNEDSNVNTTVGYLAPDNIYRLHMFLGIGMSESRLTCQNSSDIGLFLLSFLSVSVRVG